MQSELMRATVQPAFRPLTLAIKIETQGELDALGNLFNSSIVCDAIRIAFMVNLTLREDFGEYPTNWDGVFQTVLQERAIAYGRRE